MGKPNWIRGRQGFLVSGLLDYRRDRRPRRTRAAAGSHRLRLDVLEDRILLAAAPDVTTLAATNVTGSGATLNASINPQGSRTDTFIQYSTDPSFPLNIVTTLAGSAGQTGSTDGTGSAALFSDPDSVAVDGEGNVYVADSSNSTIREITPDGVVTTLAGSPGQTGSNDGTGSAALFNNPNGVAVDAAGNVYVADSGNDTIRMITPAGVVTTLAGSAGQTGSTDGTGSAALFSFPSAWPWIPRRATSMWRTPATTPSARSRPPASSPLWRAPPDLPAARTAPAAPPCSTVRRAWPWIPRRATSMWRTPATTPSARSRPPASSPPWRAPLEPAAVTTAPAVWPSSPFPRE